MLSRVILIYIFILTVSLRLSGNESDTIKLREVVISGRQSPDIYSGLSRIIYTVSPEAIRGMPVNNIQDILEYFTALDIRQRGSHGVQADISMRGGSFEQVMVLLNGVRINDPQTGHHNLNIPVNTADIQRIEILEGPGARIYGPNAFSGAINIVTRDAGGNNIRASLTGGEYGYIDLYASGGFETGPMMHFISAGNKSSDGFSENTDFNISNIFYRAATDAGFGTFDLQSGYLEKGFGASNFYTSLYPGQYEKIRSSFTNLIFTTGNRVTYRQSAYWRRHRDRFELFRENPAPWYKGHNYHMTDVSGTNATATIPWLLGNIHFGAEARMERIYSSVLGERIDAPKAVKDEKDAFYEYHKQRRQLNLTAGNSLIFNHFAVSSGVLLSKTDPAGWEMHGGIDLSYRFNSAFNWYSSVNQSHRIPSFTEMYYSSPVHNGNPYLMPEQAITMETGFRFITGGWSGHFSTFRRDGKNIIDWVRKNDELIWESRNITLINTWGIEFDFAWKRVDGQIFPVSEFRIGYAFLENSRQSENYNSAYVLDFLRHKIVTGLTLPLFRSGVLTLMTVYQDRAGTYTDFLSGSEVSYNPFFLTDIGMRYHITEKIVISLDISNIFNTGYVDIGNVPVPGRWIRAGVGLVHW